MPIKIHKSFSQKISDVADEVIVPLIEEIIDTTPRGSVGNLDGGVPDSDYGGITKIDAGGVQ